MFRSALGDDYGGLFPLVEGLSQAIGDAEKYYMGRDDMAHWKGRF